MEDHQYDLFTDYVNKRLYLYEVDIIEIFRGNRFIVVIEPVESNDFRRITKAQFSFNWKLERDKVLFKIRRIDQTDILGLISLDFVDQEERIEIRLLAVVKWNIGNGKRYEKIAGNLLAYAARLALERFGSYAAISLKPKTKLRQHYMDMYGFEQAGYSLVLTGNPLINLVNEYL